MAFNSTLSAFNRPEEVGPLIVEPLSAASVALRVSTIARTTSPEYRIPKITGDPSGDWIAPNTEIPASEASGDEINVTLRDFATISYVSNQLVSDTDPAAHDIIAQRLVADASRKIDAAYFGPHITDDEDPGYNAYRPAGLESITVGNLSRIDANPVGSSLDAFIDADAAAADAGVSIGHWVTTKYVKTAIRKLKTAGSANSYLIGTENGQLTILGKPVETSPYVSGTTAANSSVWGIPKDRAYAVLRQDVSIDFDTSVRFHYNQTAVRLTLRLGFGFPHSAGLILIRD